MQDPLGVAVERTLGIGLGFNFKHMKPLADQDTPSARRLQARTAKSAIHRVQNLYTASASELDGISNDKKRDRRQKELKAEIDKEVQYLARKLSELVPTTDSEIFGSDEGSQIYLLRDYVKTGDNEYKLKQPLPQNESLVMTKLFKDNQIPNPTKVIDLGIKLGDSDEQEENISNQRDDEFIQAYLEQKKNVGSDNDEGNTVLA
jgi:hypothetical protein